MLGIVFDLDNALDLIKSLTFVKYIIIFVAICTGIHQVYSHFTRNFDFWTKRGISGPKPVPLLGNTIYQFFTPKPILEREWLRKYGLIYGVFVGNTPVLIVAEPKLIKQILIKDFDVFPNRNLGSSRRHRILCKNLVEVHAEDWRRIRAIVSPAFSSGRMKKMYPLIRECVTNFMPALENYACNGLDLNLLQVYGNLTMDVIATCAFATKINVNKGKEDLFVKNARIIVKPNLARITAVQLLPEFLLKLINIWGIFPENSNQFFFDLTRLIINQRKSNIGQNYDDFIKLLMNAEKTLTEFQDDNDTHHTHNDMYELHHANIEMKGNEKKLIRQYSFAKFISEDEILAQSWVFFMAGYETTSTTLAHSTYELAINQDTQQRLYEEVLTAVDTNGDIDYDLLSRLPYLDSVISETLRLHSPFTRVGRRAAKDYELDDTGIVIKQKMQVEIPIYAIHVNETFHPDPFKFNPDRFMLENRHKIIPYTYLPFGGGPRNCIGLRFALLEIKLCLTQLIFRYKFIPCAKTDNPIKLSKSLFLNTPSRLFIGIESR